MIAESKPPLAEVYLAHDGVKGMKWGRRKAEEPGVGRSAAKPRLSPTNQKLVTAAAIAGTVAVGAVLLSRGNVSVWNSASNKIVMAGAKSSGRILGKTGSVIVKNSAKAGKVTAKVGLKVGKVGAKAGVKVGTGVAKSAGQATARNGQDLFNKVLKPSAASTTRLGSAAMFKLTGRGTPLVREVTRSRATLNPIDLLLNTRGDFARQRSG